MARLTAVAGGAIGILLAIVLETVIGAITIFYSLLVVTLFVPILGGLYTRRTRSGEALAAIAAGVAVMFIVRPSSRGYRWLIRLLPPHGTSPRWAVAALRNVKDLKQVPWTLSHAGLPRRHRQDSFRRHDV